MNAKGPPVTSTDPITGQSLRLEFTEQEAPSHAQAKELLGYWNECRSSGDFLMGRDIPSRAIARLTKHLSVLEPFDDGREFRFRLVGTVLNDRFGRDITGMSILDVYDAEATESFVAALGKALAGDVPVFLDVRVRGILGEVRRPEAVLLPMTAPDGAAKWILAGVFYW